MVVNQAMPECLALCVEPVSFRPRKPLDRSDCIATGVVTELPRETEAFYVGLRTWIFHPVTEMHTHFRCARREVATAAGFNSKQAVNRLRVDLGAPFWPVS